MYETRSGVVFNINIVGALSLSLSLTLSLHRSISPSLSPPGYDYDLDEWYDDSDEEEVRAHLRRVAKQPPLKLDTSSEVTAVHAH